MYQSEERIVAIHEAGHAVMAVIVNLDIIEVTIIPNSKYIGSCESIDINESGKPLNDNMLILKFKQAIQYLFGGYIAEGNYTLPTKVEAFGSSCLDICKAYEFYEWLNMCTSLSGKKKESLISIWKEAVRIMQQPLAQQQIKEVAYALMVHKTLSGNQVIEIMKNTVL